MIFNGNELSLKLLAEATTSISQTNEQENFANKTKRLS